jgi:hypothetical protein
MPQLQVLVCTHALGSIVQRNPPEHVRTHHHIHSHCAVGSAAARIGIRAGTGLICASFCCTHAARLANMAQRLHSMHAHAHTHACRCLLSKAYNAAAPLLELELTEVDPARTAVGPTDLLLYCYYGGMVATGERCSKSFVMSGAGSSRCVQFG